MRAVDELLDELDQLRSDVLDGNIEGWGGVVKFTGGREVLYIGGTFKGCATARTRAMLKVSAVVMREDDYLPPAPTSTCLH